MAIVYAFKTVNADMTAHGGFVWPTKGKVVAPDWKPTNDCGNGLHALLWGLGDSSLLDWSDSAKWLVVKFDDATMVDLEGKVKFPECTVVHCGDRSSATTYLIAKGATGVHGGTATAGDGGTATAGDWGTATAGDGGTATAGDRGTATAGDRGTATAGRRGTATAGRRGTATAGRWGTATAGDRGTATAGYRGTATAGDRGCIVIWHCGEKGYRRRCAKVDGVTIKANTPYRIDNNGNFVEVTR